MSTYDHWKAHVGRRAYCRMPVRAKLYDAETNTDCIIPVVILSCVSQWGHTRLIVSPVEGVGVRTVDIDKVSFDLPEMVNVP